MKRIVQIILSFLYSWKTGKATLRDSILEPKSAWEISRSGRRWLDVRSEKEVNEQGTLPGAFTIPHTEVEARISELGTDQSIPLLVFCAVGGRASVAKEVLSAQGFQRVFNAGGFSDLFAYGSSKDLL